MNFLFVHQSMPGQFGHLAARLAQDPANRVVFLSQGGSQAPRGAVSAIYRPRRAASSETHRYLRGFEDAVLAGQAVARAGLSLAKRGFVPDVVVAHPGWGEPMYIKDVFPQAKLVNYCEFFYRAFGADVGFDPGEAVDVEEAAAVRTRNAALLIALEAADRGLSPTLWQRSVHPREWHDKIEVIFDGVDTDRVRPDASATFRLPSGRLLTRADRVVTYVARDLEPHRGFPSFMRAVPAILAALPEAEIVIVGGDGVSYGRPPSAGGSWRAVMTEEVRPDPRRVHFLGAVSYDSYLRLLQVSAVHVYLTVPFVLSWSAMEALAAGCLVIGSRTPPVEEVLLHGENGILVDFFAPAAIAAAVVGAVRQGAALAPMRRAARETILGRYDLATCLGRQLDLLHRLTGRHPAPGIAERAA
jgi:glycosyltransferase involved in cell wall biosynthesis